MRSDKKAQVVAALRAAGYNARQVSVSCRDNTITATIRDLAVRYGAVKAALNAVEDVRRDDVSGEILCGGNTFTGVAYAQPIQDAWAGRWTQPLMDAAKAREPGDRSALIRVAGAQVGGCSVYVSRDDYDRQDMLWADPPRGSCALGLRLRCGDLTSPDAARYTAQTLGAWLYETPADTPSVSDDPPALPDDPAPAVDTVNKPPAPVAAIHTLPDRDRADNGGPVTRCGACGLQAVFMPGDTCPSCQAVMVAPVMPAAPDPLGRMAALIDPDAPPPRRPATVSAYKGHPVLTLPVNGTGTFAFGLSKARAVLAYLDDIRAFVASDGATCATAAPDPAAVRDHVAQGLAGIVDPD